MARPSADQGERVLDQLREGVEAGDLVLGTGFIAHPANPQLRPDSRRASWARRPQPRTAPPGLPDAVLVRRRGPRRPADSDPSVSAETRLRPATATTSTSPPRASAACPPPARHPAQRPLDAVQLVFDALGTEERRPPNSPCPASAASSKAATAPCPRRTAGRRPPTNEALLSAVRALSLVQPREAAPLRRVDFGNLGAEELGSVYESLLELIPHYDPDKRSYTLKVLPGNERKETGSYYTPTSLVECLLDSALDPLLDEATATRDRQKRRSPALLDLTVCDPACGSGHFLVAAARRIAKRIAAEETGESEPPETAIRKALRRVIGRCIYGVDINPMAVELAKVSLWMEALEPGKPLSYLDQNIARRATPPTMSPRRGSKSRRKRWRMISVICPSAR